MSRKKAGLLHAVVVGLLVGVTVVVVGYIYLSYQQKRAAQASRDGVLPAVTEVREWTRYATDGEGEHSYSVQPVDNAPAGTVRVWHRVSYSREGREAYLAKRKRHGMFVDGFERLKVRLILYEFKCMEAKPEFVILEIFEVADNGKTIDYAKTGSHRDWGPTPEGSIQEQLAGVVCPRKPQ